MKHHKNSVLSIKLILLLLTGLTKTAIAGNPVVHISPKPNWLSNCKSYDKRPPVRNIENGYYLELVERQINVDQAADYHHFVREIVSEAGIQNGSQISVSFDPAYERLDFHQIVVWRNNKPQSRLNPADFKLVADEEDFSKFIYQGSYSANYIIPDVRKGDRIAYDYTITGRNPVFGGRYCDDIYMQGSQIIAHQYFSLRVSALRKLNMKSFNRVPEPVITIANGVKQYVWESFQVPAADDGSNPPGWHDTYANVQISEYHSWADIINWALSVNPVSTSLHGQLAQRVAKLKAEAGDDKEKYFRLAVKMVQDEVRYMGIEIGEYSHRANQPGQVFAQRYGDCKDKALLLVSVLRANEIPADMVLVNTNLTDKINRLLPTTKAFNHAVAVATINGKQIWVDATISYQRGKGSDLYFPNYGKGLQLKTGNTGLIDIPLSKAGKITLHEKYTVNKVTDKVSLDVTSTYTLNQADDVRYRLASRGLYETEKSYLKYYAKIYPKIETRDSLMVKDDEDKNELTTIESYWIPDFFTPDSTVAGKYSAGFYANLIDEQLPAITSQTKNPIGLNYPYDLDYTIEVKIPSEWNITGRKYGVMREAYRFNSDYSSNGNSLLLNYRFAFLKDVIPLSQLEEARQDFKLMKDSKLSYSFWYTPGAGNRANIAASMQPNIWMIATALITLLICAGLAIWIYHIETPGIVFAPGATYTPLGGWLILIIIGLFFTPINVAGIFFRGDYFNLTTWNLYVHQADNTIFRAILIWETVGNVIVFSLAIFCLVLVFNKRDILPRVITCYFAFCVVLTVVDFVLSVTLHSKPASNTAVFSLLRSILVAAIWIPYFRVSERVQQTFIVPHPPYNFSYEQPEAAAE